MKKFRVTVQGETYEVEVEELSGSGGGTAPTQAPAPAAPQKQAPQAPKPSSPAPQSGGNSGGGASSGGAGGNTIPAPIAGNVLEVKVSPGDQVESGQVVMILEAMKMENEITAESSGTVKEVKADKGATVNSGDTLIVLE